MKKIYGMSNFEASYESDKGVDYLRVLPVEMPGILKLYVWFVKVSKGGIILLMELNCMIRKRKKVEYHEITYVFRLKKDSKLSLFNILEIGNATFTLYIYICRQEEKWNLSNFFFHHGRPDVKKNMKNTDKAWVQFKTWINLNKRLYSCFRTR